MPGPNNELDEIVQSFYPYASPSPVSYTKPGQPSGPPSGHGAAGTLQLRTSKDRLVAVGLPQNAPTGQPPSDSPWKVVGPVLVLVLVAALGGLAAVLIRRRCGLRDQKHGDGVALGLDEGVRDVAEILAVGLERHRRVADHLDPVRVVLVQNMARCRPLPAAECVPRESRGPRARSCGRNQVEAALEACVRRGTQGHPTGIAVRRPVRDERERRPPVTDHLERRLELKAMPTEGSNPHPREPDVARPSPVRAPSELVDRAHDLGVESDPAGEPESTPLTLPTPIRCVDPFARRRAAATGSFGRPRARAGRSFLLPG